MNVRHPLDFKVQVAFLFSCGDIFCFGSKIIIFITLTIFHLLCICCENYFLNLSKKKNASWLYKSLKKNTWSDVFHFLYYNNLFTSRLSNFRKVAKIFKKNCLKFKEITDAQN